MPCDSIQFSGRDALRLALPSGDACVIALHGAQLLSWTTSDGTERLYLSPRAVFDGQSAIRGGVPLCWPQFNQRGPLPKHGFARNRAWQPLAAAQDEAALQLVDDASTRALWPEAFSLQWRVRLASGQLHMALDVENTGDRPWPFAAALHTYLRVQDIAQARLEGLAGTPRWDAVRDLHGTQSASALAFDGEFDSVYRPAEGATLRLRHSGATIALRQSASCTETVVWNPGEALCARLHDMPGDGWRHMLCVEAARIDAPVMLAPGERWQAWQQLTVEA